MPPLADAEEPHASAGHWACFVASAQNGVASPAMPARQSWRFVPGSLPDRSPAAGSVAAGFVIVPTEPVAGPGNWLRLG